MKAFRLLTLCSVLLGGLLASSADAQTWRRALEPSYPGVSLNDIFFFDANHGWTVGSKGMVLYTTDGGPSGYDVVVDSLLDLYSVYFRDVNNGYVGAARRTLCMTTDGGATWSKATVAEIPDTAGQIKAVYFADASRGWILSTLSSTNGRILHTTDGGTTWNLDLSLTGTNSNLNDMDFWAADTGVATGKSVGSLWYTTNGTTWVHGDTAKLPTLPAYSRSDIRAVRMVSGTVAHAVGWGTASLGLQPSIHLSTKDGGATWTYMAQDSLNRTYDNLYGIWFKDALTGIAAGGSSAVVRTTDGGSNWVPIIFPCGATVNAVSGSGDNLWLCGADGILYQSTDLGNTWDLKTEVPSASLNALQWVGSNTAYAGGFDGIFLKTTDAGKVWNASFVSAEGVSQNVQDIYFVDKEIGYVAHSFRMVTKTTDGGSTWTMVLPETTAATVYSYGVFFTDANSGYVAGAYGTSNGVVHKTTDGGATWATKTAVVAKALRTVAFGDANNGVVAGAGRNILFTTDAGGSWGGATLNNVPTNRANITFRHARYLTPTTVIAVGDSTVMRSTNGGSVWEYIATESHTTLTGLEAADSLTAYAVGSKEVWKTTDAGLTWNNIIDQAVVTGTLYSVGVDGNGDPWVGGASSTIFTTALEVGVPGDPTLAREFRLDQNFPNPFNPSTLVRYELPASAEVRLVVYDLLGREVSVLVNERQTAGGHEVTFRAGNFASGMYLYRLTAGNFVQTKKMLFVK